MARTVTRAELVTRIRRKSDLENNDFVTDTEIEDYINTDITELYDLLVDAYEDYYISSTNIITDGVSSSYALPTDFYKLLGVDRLLNSGATVPLRKWNWRERNKRAISGEYPRYRINGDNLVFKIVPTSGLTLTLYYIPACPTLTLSTSTFDGVNGWEEIIVLKGAIRLLLKQESDVGDLTLQLQQITERIKKMAEDRDAGENDRMVDIQFRRRYPDSSLPPDEWEW